jgi:alcohol dehydrogenase (NADP+)
MAGIKVGGSAIGTPDEIREMLELAATTQIKPWVELRPLKEANQAVIDMQEGKAHFRYVLVNEKNLN